MQSSRCWWRWTIWRWTVLEHILTRRWTVLGQLCCGLFEWLQHSKALVDDLEFSLREQRLCPGWKKQQPWTPVD
ncbi:hypothetical protein AAFF_G00006950 [Aldrovandia affinis]|uniref:Uncharacterized protein n=1 Tax=Aldrovandia affinis TaxID=143900 RepID=A0AAD7T6Y1_9TELE|nr:hypothetical protein AAFF_G00006950 [Aldrovandia affinis]